MTRRHNAILAAAMSAERAVGISTSSACTFCDAPDAFGRSSDNGDLEMAREELATVRATELESFHLVQGIRRLAVAVENAPRVDKALTAGLGTENGAYLRVANEARMAAQHAGVALEEIYTALSELKEAPDAAVPPLTFNRS